MCLLALGCNVSTQTSDGINQVVLENKSSIWIVAIKDLVVDVTFNRIKGV
jgi:hypothetical protein